MAPARVDMRFTHALVRPPPATFERGITTAGLGPPDLPLALEQHDAYCRALERLGVALTRLPSDPAFPDGSFVEDTAVVTRRGAILARPGAPSRRKEVRSVRAGLAHSFSRLHRIEDPGTLDGGDVCEAGSRYFIGLSNRTNAEGALQLTAWLAGQGFGSSIIDITETPRLLHLKSGLAWLGGRRLLAVDALAGHEELDGWDVVRVPDAEGYAANCIGINGALLVAAGFPKTRALLDDLCYRVIPLQMSEFEKMDGGLSCLSLRW